MPNPKLRAMLSRFAACATLTAAAASPALAASAPADVETPTGTSCDDCDCLDDEAVVEVGHLDAGDAAVILGRGLARALEAARPLAATQVASTWATSDDPVRRLALAHALEWSFRLVGDSLMIDHLSRDPSPAVRAASARAAWLRRATGGDDGVLARLATDPDDTVRTIAITAR